MIDVRIAAAIVTAPVGEVAQNLDRMEKWVAVARKKGARIICFPELNVTGYCTRSEMVRAAIAPDGPEIRRILEMARTEGMVILAGMAERDDRERIFASHRVFPPEGAVGRFRKLHIAPPERGIFGAGDGIPVFEAAGLRFGIQLCYDAHFPELSTRMAEKGAEAIFIPHASPRGDARQKHDSWMRHLTARAFDNGLFVIACNQTGDNCNGLHFPGNAVILDPSGNVLQKRLKGDEGLLVADLKAEDLDHVRNHEMRYFFPNRRPSLYDR